MDIVAKVILLQLITAALAVVVLKKLLDRDLLHGAIEHAAGFHPGDDALKAERIVVVSAEKLPPSFQAKLLAVLKEKCPRARIDFLENRALKGGLVIEVGGEVWDHSLTTRLKHLFERRS